MSTSSFQKRNAESKLESEHIILKDSNGNKLECFWFAHEVILRAEGFSSFIFLRQKEPQVFNFLSKLAQQIEEANKNVRGDFVNENKFTWHHMSRAWDRPFDEETGFVATLSEEQLEINFFTAKYKTIDNNSYFVSMGGPDGYNEPYQSISNIFAITLNGLLNVVNYTEECRDDVNYKH